MRSVYLDYAATTPVDRRVADSMARCLTIDGLFGNASSNLYSYGVDAAAAVQAARLNVASLVGCKVSEVVFTSGATEADNAAIKGVAAADGLPGKHLVTMASEHKAVLMSCKSLERAGWTVSYLRPDADGSLKIDQLRAVLREETALVSIMHVNNETGVIQDLERVSQIVRETGALFHVDAAQSVGKLPLSFDSMGADLMSISAHKLYGPKGVGALVVGPRARKRLMPLLDGGGQEFGFRSGTVATHQVVGFGEACRIAQEEQHSELRRVAELRSRLISRVTAQASAVINCTGALTYPGILSVSFLDIDAFALLQALHDVAASAASACTTGTLEPSHVLRSMGIEGDRLYGAVRFSFGRFTTLEEIEFAAHRVAQEVGRLRELSE